MAGCFPRHPSRENRPEHSSFIHYYIIVCDPDTPAGADDQVHGRLGFHLENKSVEEMHRDAENCVGRL